jgi:hypothetical protein
MTHAALPSLILRGAAAGALATVPMSLTMLAAKRAGWMGKLPPEKITQSALNAADLPVDRQERKLLSLIAHFGYGVGCGSLFALLLGNRSSSPSAPLLGTAFATLVWAGSYVGWVPALGIMPTATRDRPGRPESMLVSHWVFGAALGALVRRFVSR